MAASKTIGGINVTITATIDKFQKSLSAARRLMASFSGAVKSAVFSLKGLTAGLTVAALTKFTTNQFEAIDALKDLSDKLGITTDKMAGLQLAASEVGVTNELLERSLVTLNKKMGMVGDQALRSWIEKTSKLATQQEKLAAATEMFGAKGSSMVRFLNGGTKALDEAQRAAESLGLAIDSKTAAGVDRAIEAFARFKMAVSGVFRSLAAEIAPFVESLSNSVSGFLAEGGRGRNIGATIAHGLVEGFAMFLDMLQKVVNILTEVANSIREVANIMRNPEKAVMDKVTSIGGYFMFHGSRQRLAQQDAPKPVSWGDSVRRQVAVARAGGEEKYNREQLKALQDILRAILRGGAHPSLPAANL